MEHPDRGADPRYPGTLKLDDELSLALRPVAAEDHDLIRTSWVNHLENSPIGAAVPRAIYRREQRWLVERLLASEDALVAVDAAEPWHAFGWAVGNRAAGVFHYAFVKSDFRGRGIGRFLFDALLGKPETVFFTHWRESIPRKHPGWIFDPYILARIK